MEGQSGGGARPAAEAAGAGAGLEADGVAEEDVAGVAAVRLELREPQQLQLHLPAPRSGPHSTPLAAAARTAAALPHPLPQFNSADSVTVPPDWTCVRHGDTLHAPRKRGRRRRRRARRRGAG
jgi:hypothetical protein